MAKNIIIIVLLVLVVVMFFTNMQKNKELFDEIKRRIKNQLDLANKLDTEKSSPETTVGASTEPQVSGGETAQPATQG